MKNYQSSDYAVNRYAEGIVYRFAGQTVEVTLADFLAENSGKTEQDFRALKAASDAIYYQQDREGYNQTRLDVSMESIAQLATQPLEDEFIERLDQHRALAATKELLAGGDLTVIQRRRFVMHIFHGLSSRKIAEMEGVSQRAVVKSLQAAGTKLKKHFHK